MRVRLALNRVCPLPGLYRIDRSSERILALNHCAQLLLRTSCVSDNPLGATSVSAQGATYPSRNYHISQLGLFPFAFPVQAASTHAERLAK
jgi:hypothetical protein